MYDTLVVKKEELHSDLSWLCATIRNAAEALQDEDPDEGAEVLDRVREIEAKYGLESPANGLCPPENGQ